MKGGGLSWHSQGSSKTRVRVQAHPSPTWCNTRGLQDSRATSLGTSLLLAAMCTRPIWLHGRLPCSCPARPLHPASTPPTPTLPDALYEAEAPWGLTTEAEPGKSTAWLPPCRLVLSGSSDLLRAAAAATTSPKRAKSCAGAGGGGGGKGWSQGEGEHGDGKVE